MIAMGMSRRLGVRSVSIYKQPETFLEQTDHGLTRVTHRAGRNTSVGSTVLLTAVHARAWSYGNVRDLLRGFCFTSYSTAMTAACRAPGRRKHRHRHAGHNA